MGLIGERELLQNNRVLVAVSAIIILLIIGLVHFDPAVISGFKPLFSSLLGIRLPDVWTYILPYMPILNVFFYLLGAIAVFLIGREYIIIDRFVYFSVAAYLIFIPLSGIDWSTFTTISVFPSLYLLGFYFYRIEARKTSGILFLMAGATFIVFMLLVFLTGLGILLKDRGKSSMGRYNHLAISVMLVSILIFFIGISHGYLVGYYGAINTTGYGYLLGIVSTITFAKPLFFIVLLVPLITFGFFSPRLLPVTIPYYIFGIIVVAAGTIPETLLALLDFVTPLAYIAVIRWIGRKIEVGKISPETRILKFVLFSLILMNILVFLTYIPFMGILSKLMGL